MPVTVTPAVLLYSSVGARCDGFVQLQGGRAELQAAIAAFADTAGLEQLLARHGDLLVAAAGTEDVTAVPAGDTHSQSVVMLKTPAAPHHHTFCPTGRKMDRELDSSLINLNCCILMKVTSGLRSNLQINPLIFTNT